MKITVITSLMLIVGTTALAGQTLQQDTSEYAAGVSTVEKVQLLSDKNIGTVKVASLDNGPAANPVSLVIMLMSADQQGDDVSYDVYRVSGSFNDVARTARMVGDNLVLTTIQAIPDNSPAGWKNVLKTIEIQVKQNGKRLDSPVEQ